MNESMTPSLEALLEDVVNNNNFRTVIQQAGIANTDSVEISIVHENKQSVRCCLAGSSDMPDSSSLTSNLTKEKLGEKLQEFFNNKDYTQNKTFIEALGKHINAKKDGTPFDLSIEVKDDATKNVDLVPLRLCGPPYRVC